MMTDLQQTEFEILKEYIAVCERLKLRYYLVCGSCLGAVKYSGFIPWDDDIDVAMPREDYRVLCEKAPLLLPEHLFLQTNESDRNYPNIFAKLRDSRTTYIEKGMAELDIHHGVYIDVFPLDGYPADEKEQERFEKKKTDLKHKINCIYTTKLDLLHTLMRSLRRLRGYHRHTAQYVEELIALCSAYDLESSALWCNFGNWQGKKEYAPREQYGEGTQAIFEGLQVRVPKDFDAYLSQKYGDWRADLPEDQQYGHHYYTVCNVNKPYTTYTQPDPDRRKS
ncbi:MAG: LicD family protein [Ruminococcus sp.]|nr:LicD family protein [Ruminococcus sp.]